MSPGEMKRHPEILETLHEHQTKATFFFDGNWVKKNPNLAKND